ncbi:MAG TPA: ABC transporter substrate-binding protein [Gammaproteobacteria bacterium]|nr:hypothetical protein [Xanthomonadales bacterium]MCB1593592.1 hypothetical protein [Xanthomonadales bacterium]HOP21810.1 ABC transporter substrate-binding protein [Gammaproteobacteria bacterium]HPI94963.1 ABC transporter substrate-binding protein [Gammaproteobacteria bacterium]HPQ86229.1 ABC transporter substrate-binding protein [Gammaproteobacteria bacterium]
MNKIIFREWFGHKIYPILFGLCIIVSLGAYLTLDTLQQSVDDYIEENQKQIVGGDIVITDNRPLPKELTGKISELNPDDVVFDYQFNTIAYTENKSILSRIKAVSSAYPLYGKLILKENTSNWKPGSVLVERQILTGLEVEIGDSIKIGDSEFIIHDEIITEPDRPLTAFGFGARVIMHDADLEGTGLMGQKSRVNYRVEIKFPEEKSEVYASELKELVKNTKVTINTAEQSDTSVSNLSQNFLVFLKLLVIGVIILSGVGIMSVVKAFVNRQKNTNAIRIALGEQSGSVIGSYRLLFFWMSVLSVLLAWLASYGVLLVFDDIFTAILPNDIDLRISYLSLLKAFLIALSITAMMSYFSLQSISKIKPIAVLHKHVKQTEIRKLPWLWITVSIGLLFLLLYSELDSVMKSLQILLAFAVIWLVFAGFTKFLSAILKLLLNKRVIKNWLAVLALQNIFRKGNQSNLFITALSMSTMILGSVTIMDYAIQQQLIATYPEDAPNFFLLDVQTDQQQPLNDFFGKELTYYPVVRARIDSVNGVKSEVLKNQLGRYDNISRVFNLSYADEMLNTEYLQKSVIDKKLFAEVQGDAKPVSILSSFAEFLQVDLGDEVVFNVQGIKIKTEITSIRKRLKRGPSPFFYFIFQPEVLEKAPQIRFATIKFEGQDRAQIQTELAKMFPAITVLDGEKIALKLKEFVDQLKQLIQIFTALGLIAGFLIFATSLVSTSHDRMRESFYYRMMGMFNKDILKLTLLEFITLGLFAFVLGVAVATVISYMIIEYWFSLSFIFPWFLFFQSLGVILLILIVLGVIFNRHTLSANLIGFLKTES